jgi:PAS domain S-box-containing protein
MDYNDGAFICEFEIPKNELIISETDLNGKITYANSGFVAVSGYSLDELVGHTHNIVRHPDMPKEAFKLLWQDLQNNGRWEGVIKNLRKDGRYYWVMATISTIFDKDNNKIGYKSVRISVTCYKKVQMQKEYDEIKAKTEGIKRVITYKKI